MGFLFGFRWWIVVAGFVMTLMGWEETRIAWRCRSQPEVVGVEELEKGYRPANDYLSLGAHLAIMEGVYEERVPKGQKPSEGKNPAAKLNYFYYPIVSLYSPIAASSDITQGSYAVLVKTHELKTMAELDARLGDGKPQRSEGISGVVINVVDPLDTEERDLLHSAFPQLNLDSVLLLEQDRTPQSRGSALGLMLVGIVVMIAPLALWVMSRLSNAGAPRPALTYSSIAPPVSPAIPPGSAPGAGVSSSQPPTPSQAPPLGTSTMLGYAPPRSYPPVSPAVTSGYGTPGSYGSSLPPPPSSDSQRAPLSLPPISARLQPGARVRVSRKTGDVFGTVVKAQTGQVSVNLDEGRTVWVSTDVISLA